MYHIGLQSLRAKIRGFQASGITITSRIGKAQGKKKNKLWELKRALGTHQRHHLIAYGILRGVPYHEIEKCASNNRPNPQTVLNILTEHNTWVMGVPYTKYDLAGIEQLLAAQPTAPTLAQEKAA